MSQSLAVFCAFSAFLLDVLPQCLRSSSNALNAITDNRTFYERKIGKYSKIEQSLSEMVNWKISKYY